MAFAEKYYGHALLIEHFDWTTTRYSIPYYINFVQCSKSTHAIGQNPSCVLLSCTPATHIIRFKKVYVNNRLISKNTIFRSSDLNL